MRSCLVLVLAACGSEPRVARPIASAPLEVAPTVHAPWNVVFERGCHGSMTAPVVAPDQRSFGLCDARFAYETGEYAGTFPVGAIAFLGGEVLSESFSGLGLEVEPITGTATPRSLGHGMGRDTVLSPDRTRALTVIEDGPERTLTLVALPGLTKLDAVPLATGERELGFLAGGTPIIRTAGAVSRLVDGKLVPLAAPRGIDRITVASDGTRAVVTRRGHRSIVQLPTWRELVAVPPAGEDEIRPEDGIALTATGDRVAFVTGTSLVIAAIDRDRLVELHRRPFGMPEGLAFSPDGKTLFARSGLGMQVLREGAAPRAPLAPAYDPVLPKGFVRTFQRGGPGDAGDGIERHGDGEELLPPSAFVRYRDPDVTVTAYATDAAELGTSATPLEVWADRALARHGDTPVRSKRWATATGRVLEYSTFVRDGCDPVDRYIRVEESNGITVRVEVEVPPGWPRKRVLPRLQAFFDRTPGAPKQRELATAPPPPRGGC